MDENPEEQDRRALSPAHAWGLLDLLAGGRAPWLTPTERDDVRAAVAELAGASPERWRATLEARSLVVPCWAPPQALDGFDVAPGPVLVVAHDGLIEAYVDVDAWMWLQPTVLIGAEVRERSNLLVRVPQGVWPFGADGVTAVARAADSLEHTDPQVVAAGAAALDEAARALATLPDTLPDAPTDSTTDTATDAAPAAAMAVPTGG